MFTHPGLGTIIRKFVPVVSILKLLLNTSTHTLFEWWIASPGKGGVSSSVTHEIFKIDPLSLGIMLRLKTEYVAYISSEILVPFIWSISSIGSSQNVAGAPSARPA